MIKTFIFTMAVCSITHQQCRMVPEASLSFNTYRDCALHGYSFSYDFLKSFDEKLINKEQIYTTFSCVKSENV